MSRSYEVDYALEREMRRQIAKERVSNTTEEFYKRYRNQYEELQRKGAEAYIPEEMAQLSSDLSEIRSLLVSDPFEAREISQSVGRYIHSLHGMARAAQEQFDRAMRMKAEMKREREKTQRNAALNEYYQQIQGIPPSVVNFGMERLQRLRDEIASGKVTSEAEIRSQISAISNAAEKQAADWKRNTQAKVQTEAVEKRLKEAEELVRKEKWEDEKKTQEFTERLSKLREDLAEGRTSAAEAESAVEEIESGVDEEKITEEVRRQTVIAIIKQLRSQEFIVSKPQIVDNEGESYVKITAQQPSGRRAACRIDLRGKIQYRFDHYEGMTCLKDIQKFNVDLERIYSVKLSDERILWENPDRLTREQESAPTGSSERRHG